jgi:hypothetical protein
MLKHTRNAAVSDDSSEESWWTLAMPNIVKGVTLERGAPVTLFQARIAGGGVEIGQGPQ